MQELTSEERAAFVETASAMLAQRERIEFYRDQASAAAGGRAGTIKLQETGETGIVALSDRLYRLLLIFRKTHPETAAYRFRRHLFFLTDQEGRAVAMHVVPEWSIDTIQG